MFIRLTENNKNDSHDDNDIYVYISTSVLHNSGNFLAEAPFPALFHREPHAVVTLHKDYFWCTVPKFYFNVTINLQRW